ncbi:MAG: acetyl-CoA C-acyltransferase [Syntrophaceae bacterium]|nr:acetyl-CoA C-acyltransferase [Syntrophaceae bacterium]NTW77712.1 acetyl-CoA C-acyltransferase [Syntrophaceae bacterium]
MVGKDVVIVSACRSAVGSYGGSLKDLNAAALGAVVFKDAVKRAGIDPVLIDDVRCGCVFDDKIYNNIGRVVSLMAGIPESVAATSMNRVCVSAMEAVTSGAALIKAGMADIILAGGSESMTNSPYSLPGSRWGYRLQNQVVQDDLITGLHCGSHLLPGPEKGPLKEGALIDMFRGKPYIMGLTAEFIAQYYNISREEMDIIATRSHNNVERANKDGDFVEEIVPVALKQKKGKPDKIFDKDEHFRPGMTIEAMRDLPPAFVPKIGKVTAANASGLNDGASAMLIMSAEKAKELGCTPLARIKAFGRGACHPQIMGVSPVPAVKYLEKDSGLKLADFELIELNEAFASQYLACEKEMGLNREITNVNGSGIGMGHPVGSTGCRIMVTLLYAMKKRGMTLGLATICGGGGVSLAVALEML